MRRREVVVEMTKVCVGGFQQVGPLPPPQLGSEATHGRILLMFQGFPRALHALKRFPGAFKLLLETAPTTGVRYGARIPRNKNPSENP